MNPYLSIIIPVYNVEEYLGPCIDSVLNQNFTDFQVILVNDGSKDRSADICEHYALQDSRVKVIHQLNAGVSVARNVGILAARGTYITFVDSDDWIATKMYDSMVNVINKEEHIDVIMCDFINVRNNSTEKITAEIPTGYYSKTQIINDIYPTLLVTEDFARLPIVSIWNCIFHHSLFSHQQIKFDADLKFAEDYLIMAEVMIKANTFYYLKDHFFYNYRQYDESRSKQYQPDWWENLLSLNSKLKALLVNNGDFDFGRQLKLQLLHSALFVLSCVAKNEALNGNQKRQEIKSILSNNDLKDAFKNLSLKKQEKTIKLVLFLIKHQMTLGYIVFHRAIMLLKNG